MAGANYNGGTAAQTQEVPAIGGAEGRSNLVPEARTAPVAKSSHLGDEFRAEGVHYNTDQSIGTGGPEGSGYPAGTSMTDHTPSDAVN